MRIEDLQESQSTCEGYLNAAFRSARSLLKCVDNVCKLAYNCNTIVEESKMKAIELSHDERIRAVVPEELSSPEGLIWFYISNTTNGQIRREFLFPHECTPEFLTLCEVCESLQQALIKATPVVKEQNLPLYLFD